MLSCFYVLQAYSIPEFSTHLPLPSMPMLLVEWLAPIVAIAGLLYSLVFWNGVMKGGNGTEAMQKVAAVIAIGARAFIKRQYQTITLLAVVTAMLMLIIYGLTDDVEGWAHGFEVSGAFLLGALLSGVAGVISMFVATKVNLKTASAAQDGFAGRRTRALRQRQRIRDQGTGRGDRARPSEWRGDHRTANPEDAGR